MVGPKKSEGKKSDFSLVPVYQAWLDIVSRGTKGEGATNLHVVNLGSRRFIV